MSHSLDLILPPDTGLPSCEAWNGALSNLGYEVVLDAFDWDAHSGYLPAKLLGRSSGFELHKEVEKMKRGVFKKPAEQMRISFVLHSSILELAVASAAHHSLMTLVGGEPSYEGAEMSHEQASLDAAHAYASGRFLLARLESGESGHPEDLPVLWEPIETLDMRAAMIDQMLKSRQIRRNEENGYLRLGKRTREQLQLETEG